MNDRFTLLQMMLRSSRRIIDLGCGSNPVPGASVAVDYYIEPEQRSLGHGAALDRSVFELRGIEFHNQRIDARLPFADKAFDFAYSHHVFEHLDDPATACSEMARIARAGAVITPSIFAEMAFGRPYHKWLVIDGHQTLFFFRKKDEEDRPFGEHPCWDERSGWYADESTNPFDIALDDGEWYTQDPGREFRKFSQKLRHLWYSHSPVIENIFLWRDSFQCVIADQR
jgi:SAM-dependent methyltransferase